jgi:hypothetical protein
MDESTATVAQSRLRSALSKYREHSHYGKFPEKLRAKAIDYVQKRKGEGASVREIAAELAVRLVTVKGWATLPGRARTTRKAGRESLALPQVSLVPVTVRAEPDAERWGRLEVEFADGTRVVASGIGTQALTEAIQALRRPR